MNINNPIYCFNCGCIVGYEKDFQFMVIPSGGIICPHCKSIVIHNNNPIF